MNEFLNSVEQLTNFDFLAQFEEKYHAKEFKLAHMTTANANELYHDIYLKSVLSHSDSPRTIIPTRNCTGAKTNSDSSCGYLPATFN